MQVRCDSFSAAIGPVSESRTSRPVRRWKSRASHSRAGASPKSSSMLGRSPSARSLTVWSSASTCARASISTAVRSAWRADPLDAAQRHPQGSQHLADVVVQFARQLAALVLLHRDEPVREMAQMCLRVLGPALLLLGAALRQPQAEHGSEGHDRAEQDALPEQPPQVVAERLLTPRDGGTLRRQVGVVELLDLLGDGQHGIAARDAPHGGGTPRC